MTGIRGSAPDWLKLKPVDDTYLKEMFEHIRSKAEQGDVRVASFIERETFVDALKSIAIGVENPKRLALEALRSLELPFERTTYK